MSCFLCKQVLALCCEVEVAPAVNPVKSGSVKSECSFQSGLYFNFGSIIV